MTEEAFIGVGLPPVELLVQERCDSYEGANAIEARDML